MESTQTNIPFVSTHTTVRILGFVNIPSDVAVLKAANPHEQDLTATLQIFHVLS